MMAALLLNDTFAPITSEIGFLQCDAESAVSAFVEWQKPIQSKRNVELRTEAIVGDLPTLVAALLPLTSVESLRYLFVPTTPGRWTAYFDNGWQGGDPASTISYLSERVGCRGVRAVYVPDTIGNGLHERTGRYGATILEVYSPHETEFINTERAIYAVNDGGTWDFGAFGSPLEFENVTRYKARKKCDRFTPELLQQYLNGLSIDAFAEEFYRLAEDRPAYLVRKEGPWSPNLEEYSLEEARTAAKS